MTKVKFNRRLNAETAERLITEANSRFDGDVDLLLKSLLDGGNCYSTQSPDLADSDMVGSYLKSISLSLVRSEVERQSSYLAASKTLAKLDDLKSDKTKGSAYIRLYRVLEAVLKHNEHSSDQFDRVYPNSGLLRKVSGCNKDAVDRFLEMNREIISNHIELFNLKPVLNHKGKDFDFRAFLAL